MRGIIYIIYFEIYTYLHLCILHYLSFIIYLCIRNNPTRQVHQQYSHSTANYDSRPLTHRYLDLIRELFSIQSVANWINEKSTKDQNYEWLVSCLTRSNVTTTVATRTRVDILTDFLHGTVIHVDGAGAWEANGSYVFHSILNGAGFFKKPLQYENEMVVVGLYRCKMQNNSIRWFISILPENTNPGTSADNDLYYSTAIGLDGDGRPPMSKWASIDSKYDPVPSFSIAPNGVSTSTSHGGTFDHDDEDGRSDDEDSSDHEDSMAVIDDEYAYINSAPGTPVDNTSSP